MEAALIISALLLTTGAVRMALDTARLTASLDALTAAVNTATAKITTLPADDAAAQTIITATADKIDALTAQLNAAEPAPITTGQA